MRLASIRQNGGIVAALVDGDRLLPLPGESVRGILARGASDLSREGDWIAAAHAQFAPPIPDPGKIICIGLNYGDHAAEGGHTIPEYPALFMRTATSIVGHGEPLLRPFVSDRFDYEAELLIVIGRRCRHATRETALDAVWGYGVFNDGSIRDYQRKSAQWTAGKNFDRSGAFGPAIVSKDELPAGERGLRVVSRLNGVVMQDGNTADMIFPVDEAVRIISEVMTLEPGDVIATGTPAGVGFARKPPVWMKAGDTIEIEIEGVGRLVNPVEDEVRDGG